jgi:protein SCO1/2
MLSEYLLRPQPDLTGLEGTRFPEPRPLQTFDLVDHTGKHFGNKELEGNWTFMFFGYTHCPDVCPTTMTTLNSVAQRLEDQPENARFVFISIDPERDSPEQLSRFVPYFNKEFIGVTGAPEDLERLTGQLGIMYARALENTSAGGYIMDHTASILLFDPDGHFHAVFSPPFTPEQLTRDFVKLSKAYQMLK